MNEQRFTPGQWEVLPLEHGGTYLRIRGTRLGARFKIANVHAPKDTFPGDVIESVANARLIAAAPDLLAALITLADRNITYWSETGEARSDFGSSQKAMDAFSAARAAIARALPQGAPNV